MSFQGLIIGLCLLAAILFMAKKIVSACRRKGSPACGNCPGAGTCASSPDLCDGRPLKELRPK